MSIFFASLLRQKLLKSELLFSWVGDFYEYEEDNYCIRGRRTGKKYQMGDPVRIEVARVNLARKQIDMSLADETE